MVAWRWCKVAIDGGPASPVPAAAVSNLPPKMCRPTFYCAGENKFLKISDHSQPVSVTFVSLARCICVKIRREEENGALFVVTGRQRDAKICNLKKLLKGFRIQKMTCMPLSPDDFLFSYT